MHGSFVEGGDECESDGTVELFWTHRFPVEQLSGEETA